MASRVLSLLLIDNKAYQDGYSLDQKQADEMQRYITECQRKDPTLNTNQWWNIFPATVTNVGFLFVSSAFVGGFQDRLDYITNSTHMEGGCITAANLLILGEQLLSGEMTHEEFLLELQCNTEWIPDSM